MKSFKPKNAALVAVGVLVWPTPKEALAVNLPVQIIVEWDPECAPYNISGTAQLLEFDDDPIGFPLFLIPNVELTIFSGTFQDVPSHAAKVLFDWDGDGFDPAPPQTVDLNWSGTTTLNTFGSCNFR